MAIAARGDRLILKNDGLLLHSQECCEECVPCIFACDNGSFASAIVEFSMEHGGNGYPVETYSGVLDTWSDAGTPGLIRWIGGDVFTGTEGGEAVVTVDLFCFNEGIAVSLSIGNDLIGGYTAYSDEFGQAVYHPVPTRRVDGECVIAGDVFVTGTSLFNGLPMAWMFRFELG